MERFPDEIGDWRVCILSPFGAQVHAPWGMALQHRLAERWGYDVELMWSDDGIVIRLPEAVDQFPIEELLIDPEELDDLLVAQLPGTAMFAARFRECAARALLLPRRRPDRRTPLWQQRQKAADLLGVAARYPSFPILLETSRECLNDVFDVPALRQVLSELRSRKIRVLPVDTPTASPFATSLLFGWIAQYMYEGDAPLAERRAAALSLDRELLRDLLGAEELRELLDPAVLADLEAELQRTAEGWRASTVEGVEDLLRWLGPLTPDEIALRFDARSGPDTAPAARSGPGAGLDAAGAVAALLDQRRAIPVVVAGRAVVAAPDDAARLRDALGVALPPGLPAAFTDPVAEPLVDLLSRFARTNGPFLTAAVAGALGLDESRARAGPGGAGAPGAGGAGRVPARRGGAGVVPRRGAAGAAAAVAGRPALRGGAGGARGAGPVPAGVAARRVGPPLDRRRGRRAHRAPGGGPAGLDAGIVDPAGPGAGLRPGRPRHPAHGGGDRVGGGVGPRLGRRSGAPAVA